MKLHHSETHLLSPLTENHANYHKNESHLTADLQIASPSPMSYDDIHGLAKNQVSSIKHIMDTLNQNKFRKPAPASHIHTQGTLPHHGIYDQSVKAKYDLTLMHDAALAWKAGQGKHWLNFAKQYLMAWVDKYHPSGNPIDETNFDNMISTYSVVKPMLSPKERQSAKSFFSKWGWNYVHTAEYAQKKDPVNGISNWQSHRIKLATLMAMALDDKKLFDRSKALFQHQIEKNIHADGTTYDFTKRDAIHYVVYDLQPLVQAALAAKTRGENWFNWSSKSGASLSKAIDWLTPYVTGEKTHMEFVHSKEKFDHIRQDANVNGFNGLFKPKDAGKLYWYLTKFDAKFKPIAEKAEPDAPSYIAFKSP